MNNFRKSSSNDDAVSMAKSLIKSWKKLLPGNGLIHADGYMATVLVACKPDLHASLFVILTTNQFVHFSGVVQKLMLFSFDYSLYYI